MPSPTSGSIFSVFSPSGTANIDALLGGTRWGPTASGAGLTVSYSFPVASSVWSEAQGLGYGAQGGSGQPWNHFQALTPAQQTEVRSIFAMISSFTSLKFAEVADNAASAGDIRLAFSGALADGVAGMAYFPQGYYSTSTFQGTSSPSAGDIWLNAATASSFSGAPGSHSSLTLIHEIGHSLGLKHTFESYGNFGVLTSGYDTYGYSVMSYSAIAGDPNSTMSYYPTTLMSYDVYALQYLYGKNTSYNATDTTYTFYATKPYNQVIWDAGGNDTIVYESASGACSINLAAGSWQSLGKPLTYQSATTSYAQPATVQILAGVTLENATGGEGADTLSGNAAANRLLGRGGNDRLNGGAGSDTLDGGAGSDSLSGGDGKDTLIGGLGADRLTGGTGADRFDFNALAELGLASAARDTITDFKTSEGDKIDLLGVDADTALAGNQAFTFLGVVSTFTGNATGQLRFAAVSHILYGSTDADTAAEFAITLTGVSSLSSADLVL